MPSSPNKLSQFWQELKRRNVVRVVTVYTAASLAILELVSNISDPFGLPDWTLKLVFIILIIGLIIAVILAWIYDIHPEDGMVKTEPVDKIKPEDVPKTSNSWKIATYVSVVIIIGLIAYNIFGGNRGARIDESLAKSIAVLPIHNYSGDPDQDIMCEGLTNEIISHLFKVRSFDAVQPLTSVLRYKDSDKGTSEIFQELNVNYLLEGTYLRKGEMLKVTATLIEAHSGKMIWTQDYDTPYNQVMMIPGDIALQIANNLRAFMTEGEQQSIKRMPTNNLEAYEIGNQISYLFKRWTTGEVEDPFPQMTELCNRALELDPNYAEAYAYLGLVKVIGVGFAGGEEPLSIYWDANQFLNKALELDPYNLMANFGHTVLNYWIDWDYVALEEFKEAFPNALNNQFIAESLPLLELQMGHYNEALRMKDTLIDFRTDYLIKANILLGNYKEAKDLMKQVIASNFLGFMWYGYENYIWLQEFDSAIYYMSSDPSWEYSRSSEAYYPRFKADIAVVLFKTGNEDLARTIIGELIGASDTTAVRSPAYFTGWYYSWIQEPDSAFYWLNKAVKNRSIEIPWLKVDPAFNSLRNDPRWEDLYERTGHKAYDDYMASKKE